MHVIGGASRGRKLTAPPGQAVRPTADRVRESIFDILDSLIDLEGLTVLDLFAGTGAMGIEALSRGAAHATFVERDPSVARTIAKNVAGVGLDPARTTVRSADAFVYLGRGERFDLAFADPPYAFDDWSTLVGRLSADVAVLESGRSPEPVGGWVEAGWTVCRSRRYGGTLVTVLRSQPSPPASERARAREQGPDVSPTPARPDDETRGDR